MAQDLALVYNVDTVCVCVCLCICVSVCVCVCGKGLWEVGSWLGLGKFLG